MIEMSIWYEKLTVDDTRGKKKLSMENLFVW